MNGLPTALASSTFNAEGGTVDNPYTTRIHLSRTKSCPNKWGHLFEMYKQLYKL